MDLKVILNAGVPKHMQKIFLYTYLDYPSKIYTNLNSVYIDTLSRGIKVENNLVPIHLGNHYILPLR